jgi:hypothetical protein
MDILSEAASKFPNAQRDWRQQLKGIVEPQFSL